MIEKRLDIICLDLRFSFIHLGAACVCVSPLYANVSLSHTLTYPCGVNPISL